MTGTDITRPDINPLEAFARHKQSLEVESARTDTSVGDWIRGKLAAIMESGSFEEINALMTATGLTAARDLIGHTLAIQDFAVRNTGFSDTESAWQQYCIVKAIDAETGEEYVIDGGGDQFIAGIVTMRNLYGFPFTGTLLALGTQSGRDLQYWRFHNPGRPKIARDDG